MTKITDLCCSTRQTIDSDAANHIVELYGSYRLGQISFFQCPNLSLFFCMFEGVCVVRIMLLSNVLAL